MNMLLAFAVVLVTSAVHLAALDTIRVCTYNVLRFSVDNEDGRTARFARILDSIRPHILACQEVDDASIIPRFVNDVFTWGSYAAAVYNDGPDTDNMVFYDQTIFRLLDQRVFATELRNIAEYTFERRAESGEQPDTLVVYSVHLKASDASSDVQQRAREMNVLRANLTSHRYAVVVGDYNIYGPTEPAYRALVAPSSGRRFVDPVGTSWGRNDSRQANIYSQASRTDGDGACGGGVGGGLDDRFDLILPSEELAERLLPTSYSVFGNDGQARLNASVAVPPNTRVSASLAEDLRCASDHLPVYCDFVLGSPTASVRFSPSMTTLSITVGKGASAITVRGLTAGTSYTVYDTTGRAVLRVTAEGPVETWDVSRLPSGRYSIADTAGRSGGSFGLAR
ncbi:MAG: endonuclease/exonuclease/phosphatase family protein [Candidatus Kapabacteria bacterium]|jgi:endonuclease/exonuclease/phosphatase family metal-dependent hydrolase|nr:endonuclease/exonuclease/phosphatase family protein [Candidatus Kapabacteria bacterium]